MASRPKREYDTLGCRSRLIRPSSQRSASSSLILPLRPRRTREAILLRDRLSGFAVLGLSSFLELYSFPELYWTRYFCRERYCLTASLVDSVAGKKYFTAWPHSWQIL